MSNAIPEERGHDGLTGEERIAQMSQPPSKDAWPCCDCVALRAERDALKQKFEDEEMAWKHAEEVNGKLEAELATARQTIERLETKYEDSFEQLGVKSLAELVERYDNVIERLSAPVSDEECNVVMFRVDSGHTFGAILDALIAARKDARSNDKEKA
jgi:hypothetical protein